MPSRLETIETTYQAAIAAVPGISQCKAGSHFGRLNFTQFPAFGIFFDGAEHRKTIVATAGSLKVIKAVKFIGVLMVKAGDLDEARLAAYPLVDAVRAALEGVVVDYPTEMTGPTVPKSEDPVTVEVGVYGYMMEWEFEMSFSKGVA